MPNGGGLVLLFLVVFAVAALYARVRRLKRTLGTLALLQCVAVAGRIAAWWTAFHAALEAFAVTWIAARRAGPGLVKIEPELRTAIDRLHGWTPKVNGAARTRA